MKKAPDAFRTISEVSELLDTPAHVLRFWESKFYQIRPVKRAGGRRYYRPEDVALLAGIQLLLQDRGMTIRGVQKVLQEQGVRHVASLAPALPAGGSTLDESGAVIDEAEAEAEARGEAGEAGEAEVIAMPLAPRPPASGAAREPGASAASPATPSAARPAADPAAGAPGAAPAATGAAVAPPAPAPAGPRVIARSPASPPPPPPPEEAATADRPVQRLRALPREALLAHRDRLGVLARRIDALLERMAEAAGAGRW